MHPAGHALALIVPFYSLNRVFVHYRVINQEATALGVKRAIDPVGAVLGVILPLISVVTGLIVMASGQRALNRVWEASYGPASEKRACVGEWVSVLVLPVLLIAGFVSLSTHNPARIVAATGECRGWDAYLPEHERLINREELFWSDFNSVRVPANDDFSRWSAAVRSLRLDYEHVERPPVMEGYVQAQIDGLLNYEKGFSLQAEGRSSEARTLLNAGDDILQETEAALDLANKRCAGA